MDANARVDAEMTTVPYAQVEPMLLKLCNEYGSQWWKRIHTIYGDRIGLQPTFKLNRRLTRTIARAWMDRGFIDVSVSINAAYPRAFVNIIIPHEFAHFVAFRLYGDVGHQRPWKDVMIRLGLPPTATFDVEKY